MRRVVLAIVSVLLAAVLILGVAGYALFTRPHGDPLAKADAIVVLGGEQDGRVQYGLDLARQGYAGTVVISAGDLDGDATTRRACASGTSQLTVVCFRPSPFTTRGEAMFVQRLGSQRGWRHVIVISWNYHLVRARYVFHQCFDGTVTMRPVPRPYDFNLERWAWIYAYQYGGMVKAAILGCDGA